MFNVKFGDKVQDGLVNVIVSEGSEDGREVDSWSSLGSYAFDDLLENGYEILEYLGNGSYSAARS